jgi:hypothetical protein
MLLTSTHIGREITPAVSSYGKREKSAVVPINQPACKAPLSKPRYMSAHRFQEVLHGGQQSERIIQYGASTFPKAFNQGFLTGDAVFLLRHVADAHLQFCLAYPHGVLSAMAARTAAYWQSIGAGG